MDAVSMLSKHISISRVLAHYGFVDVKEEKGYLRCACKIHGGNNSSGFVANEESGLWFCHTGGCGGGDAYTLVQKMDNVNFPESVKRVAAIHNIDIGELTIVERKAEHIAEMQKWIKAIRGKKKESQTPYQLNVETKKVKKFRSFQLETIEKFGLVYVPEMECEKQDGGTYTLRNRLGFPIIDENGVMIGISLRRINNNDVPKWSHQPVRIKTGDLLYNFCNVKHMDTFVLTEGMPDVWAFDEVGLPATATYGAHLSEWQYKMIIRSGVSNVVLAYDGDHAGREATRKAITMLKGKVNLYVIQFEEGEDPESIPREELKKRYESRTKV